MAWTQLRVQTAHAEFAEEILLGQGALSVTLTDAADEPILEPGPGETPLWAVSVVTGLFGADQDLDRDRAALREMLPDGCDARFDSDALDDADWVRECLKHARPMRFGERLWICPSNHRVDEPGAVVVKLDPGLAFGTGTHPTTAMCLRWLADQPLDGVELLDFGCGSGILAVAALKLGAAGARGVDIDPQAVQATMDNAAVNGVAERITASLPADLEPRRFPVVVANILANPLIELAPRILDSLAPGGRLALAGLLSGQVDAVRAAYAPRMELAPVERDGDWVCLAGQLADT